MGSFYKIREALWPILDPEEESQIKSISDIDLKIDGKDIDQALELAQEYYNSEKERVKQVESKSTIFIGSFGVAIAIIIAVVKDIMDSSSVKYDLFSIITILGLSVVVIYLCRALLFSIKALERKGFSNIGYKDIIQPKGDIDYKKHLITCLINYTRINFKAVNEKVDYMTMAQEYFKRAIICIIGFSIFLCAYTSFFSNSNIGTTISKVLRNISQVKVNTWIIILIFMLICICIIWLTINSIRYKKILKNMESK